MDILLSTWDFVKSNYFCILLSIISCILTYHWGKKSLKLKSPAYSIKTIKLVTKGLTKIPLVKIQYNDNEVNNISVTRLVFWNRGSETIRKDDVSGRFPINLVIEGSHQILDAQIVHQNNEANEFDLNISEDKTQVAIDFDFIDKDNGFVAQILHTGYNCKALEVKGSIKSVPMIVRLDYNVSFRFVFERAFLNMLNNPTLSAYRSPQSRRSFITTMRVVFLLAGVIGMALAIIPSVLDATIGPFTRIMSGITGGFYIFFIALSFQKSGIPKDLNKHFSEFD